MVQFEQHFVQDLTQPIKVRHCGTIVFNADDESNVISVRLFNGSEPVAISGSVVGAVVCSDGSTVTLSGSYSGNTASITLTGDCFAILGQIGVGIQIVNGTQKTTVLKVIYNVETLTTENVVDPGSRITLEVGDLIDDIETAVASIPADYSDLLAAIAPNYSGLTFPVKAGTFCWYDGTLYQAQQDIATSEAWTAAHWASSVLTTSLDEKLADVDDELGDLKSIIDTLEENIGDDWDTDIVTVNPTTASVQGYAYFSPVQTGSTVQFSTNSGHSYNIYTNMTVGESYHFKTYANSTWNNNHIVCANSSGKVTGFAVGQQSTAGSVEADYTIPTDTTTVYVICNKSTADTTSSVAVTKVSIIPLTTDFQAVKDDVEDLQTDVGAITAATAEDVGKALSPKTVADGKVTEWEFITAGGGSSGAENRYVSVLPVASSAANGRTNATVGSTVSFGTQTDWYHVKFAATAGKTYRGTYYSSNSTKYNNIVAVDSSEKVLAILNDTPSGAGVITKEFTAPENTAYLYLCNYGTVNRVDSVILLEVVEELTDTERLDNVEEQATAASFDITNDTVHAYFDNVTYTDGDYSTSEVNNYRTNPKNYMRTDIPNPVVIRWNPINNAVRITAIVTTGNELTYARYIAYECDPNSSAKAIYNLLPNATYKYQVIATLESGIDTILAKGQFTTANSVVRMLYIDGIQNVRDIGGIAAGSSSVAYGKIIRGSELDAAGFQSSAALTITNGYSKITDAGRDELINHVGIRAELDLRAAGTYGLLPSLDYQAVGFPFYDDIFTENGLAALNTAFSFVLTEINAGKPVYIHCQGGNDRTGTLITCLLGLLGASENSLSKEYELSSFVFGESRMRNSTSYKFGALMNGVLALSGDTLADKFATLFTNASISAENITAFRNAMLVE